MPTRGQVCTWIAGVVLLAPSVVAGQNRSEREIVELIVREGPQAAAIRADVDVTRLEREARLAWANPALTYSRESAGFTEFLQVEQPLSLFGARSALASAGAADTSSAEAVRDARLWRLRSEAAVTAARLVAEQARLELAQAQTEIVARLVEVVRTREREGEGSRFDRLRAEQEHRETRQLAISAAAGVAEARAALESMLPAGVRVLRLVDPRAPAVNPVNREALVARATGVRAELRALGHDAQRTTLESDAARRSRLPSPSIFGGMKRADDAGRRVTGGVFGVNVSIPLFDTGGRDAARWTAERARIDAEAAAMAVRIRSEVSGAVDVLSLRHAALAEDQPTASGELAQIAEVAYREGEVGILEWLDAVRAVSRAKVRRVDLELDARLAEIALERAVGEPLWP